MAIYRKINGKLVKLAVSRHNELDGRDEMNCHPISAIRNLPEKLNCLKTKGKETRDLLNKEIQDRIDAVSDEASKRELADSNLDSKINTEISNRQTTDNTLQGNINTERDARVNADNELQRNLNAEITNRTSADTNLNNRITSEVNTLNNKIDNEAGARSDADDALSDLIGNVRTNARKIDLKEDEVNKGKLLFTDYDNNTVSLQGGFLPDGDTLKLIDNDTKLAIKKVYVDSDTLIGDGASSNTKLNAKAIKDANGTITVSNIVDMNQEIQALQGRGGYLRPYDFDTTRPNLPLDDLSTHTYSLLTQYALQEITNITDPIEIFNGTRVTNLENNHTWILNNTPDTTPAVFEWVDLGQSLVSTATNDTLGIVKGSDDDLAVSVDLDGVMTVNGLPELVETVEGKQDALSQSQINAVNSGINNTKVEQITTNTNNISAITNGTDIDNFAEVETALSNKQDLMSVISNEEIHEITNEIFYPTTESNE